MMSRVPVYPTPPEKAQKIVVMAKDDIFHWSCGVALQNKCIKGMG